MLDLYGPRITNPSHSYTSSSQTLHMSLDVPSTSSASSASSASSGVKINVKFAEQDVNEDGCPRPKRNKKKLDSRNVLN